MNDWYNDPPDPPEPPDWYSAIEDAIADYPPPTTVADAIKKALNDWNQEQQPAYALDDYTGPDNMADIEPQEMEDDR